MGRPIGEIKRLASRLPLPPLFGFIGHTRVMAALSAFGAMTYNEITRVLCPAKPPRLRKYMRRQVEAISLRLAAMGVAVVGSDPKYVSLNAAHPACKQIRALGRKIFATYLRCHEKPAARPLLKDGVTNLNPAVNLFGKRGKHDAILLAAASGERGVSASELAETASMSGFNSQIALASWYHLGVLERRKTRLRPTRPEFAYRLDPKHFAFMQMRPLLDRWLDAVEPEYRVMAKELGLVPRPHPVR